jgi:hypothetical protein
VCPFVEMAVHSNGNIFQTGQDGETSMAVLLLLVELLFALSSPLISLVWNTLELESLVFSGRILQSPFKVSFYLPELSPPLFLRI